jgi:flagellar biosynthesis protein FlhG
MVDAHDDQAAGLRRMLAFSHARTIAVVAGTRGAGATSCVVNLASSINRQGRRVMVVDENYDNNVSQSLGIRPRFDLRHAIEGECATGEALTWGPGGIAVLAAAGAARALQRLDPQSEARAIRCFGELDGAADVVLIDARNDADDPSPFTAAAQEVIVVVSPGSSSITGGYTAIKRMCRTHARMRFRLLVNRAPDDVTARLIQTNMAQVTRKHLDVALEYMGAIPIDPAVLVSVRRFSAAVDAAPTAAASRRYCEYADAMLRWSAPQDDVSRLDTFMQRAIYGSRLQAAGAGA